MVLPSGQVERLLTILMDRLEMLNSLPMQGAVELTVKGALLDLAAIVAALHVEIERLKVVRIEHNRN